MARKALPRECNSRRKKQRQAVPSADEHRFEPERDPKPAGEANTGPLSIAPREIYHGLMADEQPQEEQRVDFQVNPNQANALFATGVMASRPGKMVWLEFQQVDPFADPPRGQAVVRVVFTEEVAEELLKQLFAIMPPAAAD